MGTIKDMTGQRVGRLTVIKMMPGRSELRGYVLWQCRCDCQKEVIVSGFDLRKGHTKSCGCLVHEVKNIAGQVFERLTVLKLTTERNKKGRQLWLCECTCGTHITVTSNALQSGNTKSCGCLAIEKVTIHGLTGHELFSTWLGMIQRCENPNAHGYEEYYGGRGVKVYERWRHSFPNWLAYMGERPSPKHSIDRYPDPYGNYEPGNVRWATQRQQRLNARKSLTWGIRETPSGKYRAEIQMCAGGRQLTLGSFNTEADAITMRRQAELARDKNIAVRRGEGGGLVFIDRGVRMRRLHLHRLLFPFYDEDQMPDGIAA